jgi:hypothetical protein
MRNFVSSLYRVSGNFQSESDSLRTDGDNLQDRYQDLQAQIKRTRVRRERPTGGGPYSHPPHISRRAGSHIAASRPIGVFDRIPDPNRNYALPRRPCIGVNRIYQSPARQKLRDDILFGWEDYKQFPTPSGLLEYESQVDPYLHIGSFPDGELSRTVTGAGTKRHTFY